MRLCVLVHATLSLTACSELWAQAEARVRFCTLDSSMVAAGRASGHLALVDTGSIQTRELARQLGVEAGSLTIGRALSESECDAVAQRLAERSSIAIRPTAVYSLGAGFYVWQPAHGGREALEYIVDGSFIVQQHWFSTD